MNIASPAQSLMLLKPTAAVPHTGGQVLKPGSRILRIAPPMDRRRRPAQPDVAARDRHRGHAAKTPSSKRSAPGSRFASWPPIPTARERDVTREAFVESGNTDVVKTVPEQPGLLEALRRGEAAALVRYEGNYAATTLTVMGDRAGFAWEDPPANNRIDELVAAKLQAHENAPLRRCANDYEFVRRVYLDLTGLPPTPEQIQAFVDDTRESKAKRDALVDKLIGSDDYIEYWTNKWADLLMVNRKFLGVEGATALRNWIRGELAANTPYDQFVRKILTATGSTKDNPAGCVFQNPAHAAKR